MPTKRPLFWSTSKRLMTTCHQEVEEAEEVTEAEEVVEVVAKTLVAEVAAKTLVPDHKAEEDKTQSNL